MLARKLTAVSGAFDRSPSTCRLQFPCAPSQERFWFEDALHPGNPGLNVAVRWRLEGFVSATDLQCAWEQIVARHDALRTSFAMDLDAPVQVVEPHVNFAVETIDLSDRGDEEANREAERLASLEALRPFDLTTAPILRVTRVIVNSGVSILLVTTHHTVCDGWSIGILAREMGQICEALQSARGPSLPALPLSYGDYSLREREWLASERFDREAAFLRTAFADYKQFELMPDRARPSIQTSHGAILSVLLPRRVTDRLAALSRERACTMFVTALTSLMVLLHKHSGENDIAIGTQVVGRDDEDLENIVGCFINTVAIRGDLEGNPAFTDLLERVRDHVLDVLEVRRVPVERLVEIVNPKRDIGRNALFSVNFIFQKSFIENARYGSFALVDMPSRSAGALYDLNFFMVERPDGWRASCEYNTDIFDAQTVANLLRRFATLLEAIGEEPSLAIEELPLLDAGDVAELDDVNRTWAEYPRSRTFPELFADAVARTPDAIAIEQGGTVLTYAQVDASANRIARALQSRCFAPTTRVGVLLERSPDLVIALLGVLKSGASYVPLDPAYPTARIDYIAQSSGLAAIVTRDAMSGRAGAIGVPLFLVDAPELAALDGTPLARTASPDDVAYVIYTSGSTGRPKGVAVAHRSLVNLLCAMRTAPGLDASDVFIAVTTVSFDIAALELFLPLLVGARLVIASNEEATDGHLLRTIIERHRATAMQATPVTWQILLEAGWNGTPPLKMLCGGEALSRELASRLLACGNELWNLYGPTETTIWSAALRVESGVGPVAIGAPIANTQFFVLDASGHRVPPGAPGELYIGGDGVALGYFERPDLTPERFVPNVFGGDAGGHMYRTGDLVRQRGDRFEFLGRVDNQIKLRGFRIELGEIEAALLRAPDVAEAVAIVGEDAFGEKTLWAYAVPTRTLSGSGDEWTTALRGRLAESLPSYMLPSPIVALPRLPRTPNGKIDRLALPAPHESGGERSSGSAPQTRTEVALATALVEMLGREQIDRNVDVFSIGFHSLLAVRLVARIATDLNVTVPLRALFDHPTVASLGSLIDERTVADESDATTSAIVRYNGGGVRTPFLYFHSDLFAEGLYCRNIAAALGPSQPFVTIAPHGTADLPALPTIESMAADYYGRIREIQPHGPYRLGGFCVSGLIAYDIARRLRAEGETVEDVLLINSSSLPTRSIAAFDWLVRRVGMEVRLSPRWRENLVYNIARLHAAALRGPLPAISFVFDRLRSYAFRKKARSGNQQAEPLPFEKHSGERETENSFAHLVASLTYHPRSYDGNVTLIWSSDQKLSSDDPTVGWRDVAPRTTVETISGGHVSPLAERLDEIGALLRALLAR